MSELDAPSAASSAAPVTPPMPSLDSLSESDLSNWRLTGEFPTATPDSTPNADSSPAEPVEQVASTDAPEPPASEPGKPSHKSNADTRKAELAREIETLLAQRNELLKEIRESSPRPSPRTPDAAPAESSPAPSSTLAQTVAHPDIAKPLLTDTEFFAAFPDASLTDFTRYVSRYERASDLVASQRSSERRTRAESYQAKVTEAQKADPKFWDKVDPRVLNLPTLDLLQPGESVTPLHVIGQELLTSDLAPKLLVYLSEHQGEIDRLARLPHAAAIAREIGKLEAKLDSPTAPPVKAVSSAPPPPSTLGSKPATASADEADEALREGNFERYQAAMNRRELAANR